MAYSNATFDDIKVGATVYRYSESSKDYKSLTVSSVTPSSISEMKLSKDGKRKTFNITFVDSPTSNLAAVYLEENNNVTVFTASGEQDLFKQSTGGRRRFRKTQKKMRKNRRRSCCRK